MEWSAWLQAVTVEVAVCAPPRRVTVHIGLLGTPRIEVGGVNVTARVKYRKAWALLAYLVANAGRTHTREQLADLFWPGLSLRAARTNLRQVLHNLSTVLQHAAKGQSPVLSIDKHSVCLAASPVLAVDFLWLWDERRRCDAGFDTVPTPAGLMKLETDAAEPLAYTLIDGIELLDCEGFSSWLDELRRDVRDGVVAILRSRGKTAVAWGRTDLAIAFAEQIQAIDPLHEGNQARLIELLALVGRGERALQQYNLFAKRLREELDVEPARATRQLRARILEQQHAPAHGLADAAPASRPVVAYTGRLCLVSVVHVSYTGDACDALQRAIQAQEIRGQVAMVLRQHRGHIMASSGLGANAWFLASGAREAGNRVAIDAARAVLAQGTVSGDLRVGICTRYVTAGTNGHPGAGVEEVTELARRISLIGESRQIVICEDTLRESHEATAALGEWTFRGLGRPVTVFRLTA